MKYMYILILLFITMPMIAQTVKTVEPSQPGTLRTAFTTSELTSVTSLTLKGKIDARDFVFLRDELKNIATLNMTLVSIMAYSGSDGPNGGTMTSYPANEIPAFAFYNPIFQTYKSSLTSVTLPVSAVSIGTQAFYFSWNIGSLNIPNNLKKIGDYAFYGCYALSSFTATTSHTRYAADNGVLYNKAKDTLFLCPNAKTGSLVIPSTVKHIDKSAFENCYNLTSITLPSTLQSTGTYAFAYCSGISGNLSLPASLKSLSDGAFYGCYNLTGTVTLPASLTQMGSYCFFESSNIQAFSVNTSNSRYSSADGILYSKLADTLLICPAGKTGHVSLPETTRFIGSHAFYGCSKLTGTLTIPSLTDYISYYAFNGCTGLQAYAVSSQNNWFTAENGILYSRLKDRILACPSAFTGNFIFPATIVSIDPGAFSNCTGINGPIQLPQALSWIGEFAFYNCPAISGFEVTSANPWFSAVDGVLFNKNADTLYICPLSKQGNYTLPNGVRHIGASAFAGCENLTGLQTGSNLQSLGASAFSYCSSLQTVHLSAGVNSIGSGAFYYCTGLNRFSIAQSAPPLIDYYTFNQANQSGAQLVVPTGSEQLYRAAPYWQNFPVINEESFGTAIEQTLINKGNLINTPTGIRITGLQKGETVMVFTSAGKQLISTIASNEELSLPFSAKGIFVVKTKHLTEKFIR